MTKKILSAVLPALTFLALTGTGFGVWVFNADNDSQVEYANYEVTSAAGLNGLTLNLTDSNIILDASGSDLTIGGNLGCTINLEKGIVGTVNASNDGYDVTETSGTLDLKVNYHIAIAFTGGIEKYLSTDTITLDSVSPTSSTTYDFAKDYSLSGTYSYALSVSFKWTAFPSSIDDYTEMVKTIKSADSKITITASIPETPVLTIK
jgi:hypothetical protein